MKEDAFSILHDGIITAVSGACPGTLFLEVDCDYLRERFSAPGNTFKIAIENCEIFYYETPDKQETDLSVISNLGLEILSAENRDGQVLVYTGTGVLHLRYEKLAVYLNDRTPVSEVELENVAESYWEEWSRQIERRL
jgi:hypothetical protein